MVPYRLLTVNDFAPGSVDETAPGMIPPACSPASPAGFVQQASFQVTDVSGKNWLNFVFAFDTAADAHAFVTAFFTAAMQCGTGGGATVDTLGDYSFVYTQKGYGGGFGDATVEVVQVKYLITMLLDGPNLGGPNPPLSALRTLAQTSVARVTSATG